jgi:polysaccharide biosynthesis protein PelA
MIENHRLQRPSALRDEQRKVVLDASNEIAERQLAVGGGGRIVNSRRSLLVTLLAFTALAIPRLHRDSQAREQVRFLIDYSSTVDRRVDHYDIAVLDANVAHPIISARRPGAIFLGYLSLGEIHSGRDYFSNAAAEGFILRPNPSWPDARFVDLRNQRWHDRVINQLVPEILAKGFNGIFLDTLDDAEFLERQEPARCAGMVDAAAALLRKIHQQFPGVSLMVNRGYAVLPRAAGAFDMLLGESVVTTWDSATHGYRPTSESDAHWQIEQMRQAQRRDPKLRLFSLDYWSADDPKGIARIYAQERMNGFIPYVGTRDLTKIVIEP